jgi:hypothetical protein
VFLTLPLPIGVMAALYTTQRYLLKLREWTQLFKTKKKNENAYARTDDVTDEDYLLLTEAQSQRDNLTI